MVTDMPPSYNVDYQNQSNNCPRRLNKFSKLDKGDDLMKYSIIIPFHSNINLLTACVSSIFRSIDKAESEIIIVDNNADESQIQKDSPLRNVCRIIGRQENLLYPKAINLGASEAQGDKLIFCDADTFVLPGFQAKLLNALTKKSVGYASAKLLNMSSNRIQEFGITYSYYNFPHPFAGRSINHPLVVQSHYPLAACAACSAIDRKLFLNMGGFDTRLLHSYSDIDLCLRLTENGYKTVCVADALAYHKGSSTTGSGMSSSLKEDTKGIFMSLHKDIPIQITEYLSMACEYFLKVNSLVDREYFIFDCSTIGNSDLYLQYLADRLDLSISDIYKHPYYQRDAAKIDLLTFVSHHIRNFNIPILYFTDTISAFEGNGLWKFCREKFADIVVDRHANIEFLKDIRL